MLVAFLLQPAILLQADVCVCVFIREKLLRTPCPTMPPETRAWGAAMTSRPRPFCYGAALTGSRIGLATRKHRA